MSPAALPSVIIAAAIAALLSGMGVGSAGLFVLYLTMVAGYSQPTAQALNLVFFLFSAGASLLVHVRHRRIPWRIVTFFSVCAIPGALMGSLLAARLDASLLRRLFGGMLTATGLYTLLRPAPKHRKATEESRKTP